MSKISARSGGIESKLDGFAIAVLVSSILLSLLCLIIAFVLKGSLVLLIIVSVLILGQGIYWWVIYKAGAEVIRLLKKIAGLPYAGKILETVGEGQEFVCTDCEAPVSVLDKYCTQCGSSLEEEGK